MNLLENQLKRLQYVGNQIKQHGPEYPLLSEAFQQFWVFVLQETLDFDESTLSFTDEETLNQYVALNNQQYYTTLYSALPPIAHEQISQDEFIAHYYEMPFLQKNNEERFYLGSYNILFDRCYVLSSIPFVDTADVPSMQASVFLHELAHRHLAEERKEMGFSDCVYNPIEEERFCTYIEKLFLSWTFDRETSISKGLGAEISLDQALYERMPAQVAYEHNLDPHQIADFHQNAIYQAVTYHLHLDDD